MAKRRMSPADAAWLRVDRPENPMVVTAVLRLDGLVSLEELAALVRERLLARYPRLSRRVLAARVPWWPPSWQDDPAFDLSHHVVEDAFDGPLSGAGLPGLVGELMSRPLDLRRPPWVLHLIHGTDGRSAVVARLHHCIADGVALAQVLLAITDPDDHAQPLLIKGSGSPEPPRPVGPGRIVGAVVRTLAQALSYLSEPASALRGRTGTRKRAAWTGSHELQDVKRIAAVHGAKVNDVLLAAVAGGLRQQLIARGQQPVDVRVTVPADLRGAAHPVTAELGNRFGVVFVLLPASEPDAARRLQLVARRTAAVKSSLQAAGTFAILAMIGALPTVASGLAVSLLDSITSAVVTNVPGPRRRLRLAGATLDALVFWVPQVGRIGLGVSLFSYADTVTVGVVADARLDVDPGDLAAAIEAELAVLARAAPAPR